MVLRRGKTPAAYAVLTSPGDADSLGRAAALASQMIVIIAQWVDQWDIQRLQICVETPIWNKNAATLMLQMRLLQEFESGLYHVIGPEMKECHLYEVNPSTSKLLATGFGKATKEQIIGASPFMSLWSTDPPPVPIMEAVADAWAHSLIADSSDVLSYDLVTVQPVPCDIVTLAALITVPSQTRGIEEEENDEE